MRIIKNRLREVLPGTSVFLECALQTRTFMFALDSTKLTYRRGKKLTMTPLTQFGLPAVAAWITSVAGLTTRTLTSRNSFSVTVQSDGSPTSRAFATLCVQYFGRSPSLRCSSQTLPSSMVASLKLTSVRFWVMKRN